MKQALIDYIKRGRNDEIYTPEYAIAPILSYIPKDKIIWECTDFGGSGITKVLRENGYTVISTHKDNMNFLTGTPDFDFDIIVTNPPYSIKDEFLAKCYEYGKPFALLLPLTALEGITRGKLYREHGIEVMVLDRRVNFIGGGDKKNNWFNTSWYCHGLLPEKLMFIAMEKEKTEDDE